MSVSALHILSQGSSLAALGRVALRSLGARTEGDAPATPGPWVEERVAAPSEALVRAFIKNAGGDPGWYRSVIPASMFAQWTFSAVSKALSALPWPMTRVLNAGVTIVRAGAIAQGRSLRVRARLASVQADEHRAKITTEVETGPEGDPAALSALLHTYLPFGKPSKSREKREPERAGAQAKELAYWSLSRTAGRDFALLTGDVNPIHWIAPAAKMAGFRSVILHGFASMARSIEGLNRAVFVGDPTRLGSMDVRFLRPLALPARVGLYLDRASNQCWIADGPSGPAYLSATFGVLR
jgi:acyl dehydratase